MKNGEREKRAVKETIGWIQRITVEKLDLNVKPEDLAPDAKFTDLEVTQMGDLLDLDSIDLVEVIEAIADTFDEDDLLEELQKEFEKQDFTIQNMAGFLVKRFELDPGWVQALAGSAK